MQADAVTTIPSMQPAYNEVEDEKNDEADKHDCINSEAQKEILR